MSARTRILAHQLNAMYHTAVGRQHAVKYSGQFQVTASIVGNVSVGIHAALEFFSTQQLAGEAEPSLDELLDVYQQSWRDRLEQEVHFNKSEATFDESKLDRTKRVFESVRSAIWAGHFYPAPNPMQCSGCGYRSQCDAWRGNHK